MTERAAIALTLESPLFQFIVAIAMIVQAFNVKAIIEDHGSSQDRSEPFAEHVKLSGVMTFFFSIFYLQWAIDRYVVGPRA